MRLHMTIRLEGATEEQTIDVAAGLVANRIKFQLRPTDTWWALKVLREDLPKVESILEAMGGQANDDDDPNPPLDIPGIVEVPTADPNVTRLEAAPPKRPTVTKLPSLATMRKWMDAGVARTECGCRVEPDGECRHGKPSLLRVSGII